MTKSRWVDFQQVKAAVSITAVLQRYGLLDDLTQRGESLRGCCPLHEGDNPTSFSVDPARNVWHCFACDASGSVIDLVAHLEDISFRSAALKLTEWFEIKSKPPRSPGRGRKARKERRESPQTDDRQRGKGRGTRRERPERSHVNSPLGFSLKHLDQGHPYLGERGLHPETIEAFGLGYCSKGIMAGRIAIPIHNRTGELIAYAGRYPGEPPEGEGKYKLPDGFQKGLELFNQHRLEEASEEPLIVVEGFFDAIQLWQVGFRQVVALMGSSLSERQAERLIELAGRLVRIVILFDEDDAGRKGREQALARLAPQAFVRVVALPEAGMQPEQLSDEQLREIL